MIKHAYIHIPFCLRKCKYCSFVSGLDISYKDIYINSLLKEIKSKYKSDKLSTLYFGGGTPSLLDAKDIEKILVNFNFEDLKEITLETNPESISSQKLSDFKSLGINRISLGVQSFNNHILKLIGREHNEKTIYNAVSKVLNTGFENLSIDIIYGLPSQTFSTFKDDLNKAINLDIKHISTYGLKIEENSYFYLNPPDNLPDEDTQAKFYLYMCNFLKEHSFEHYEISNFSKHGFESKHNLCYWKNKNYYGFGLNASGYEGNIRYRNSSKMENYLKNPTEKEEQITLSKREIKEEEIFLGLRLKEGVKEYNFSKEQKKIINKYIAAKLIETEDDRIYLNEKGMLVSNEIMSEFID